MEPPSLEEAANEPFIEHDGSPELRFFWLDLPKIDSMASEEVEVEDMAYDACDHITTTRTDERLTIQTKGHLFVCCECE
jgi:hypothetical protein